jgi:hypothetical protein
VSVIQTDVVAALAARWKRKLEWNTRFLTPARVRRYMDVLRRKEHVRGIWGFVDGSVHKIGRPESDQRQYYSGYKKAHCLNYMGIVTPDGLMASFTGPFAGRWSDQHVFRNSRLPERLLEVSSIH